MADDFDAAGISWWSTARTAPTASSSSSSSGSFGGSSAVAAAASASCSAAIADPGTTIGQQSASDPLIYSTDWNQSLLRNSDSTRFHSMLQENFNYLSIDSGRHHQPHHQMGSEQFMVDHQQPALSMMLQGLFEQPPPEAKPPQPIFSYQSPSAAMSSHFLTSPPTKQQQFSNNPSAAGAARSELYPSALPVQFSTATAQSYEHNPSCSSPSTSKWSSDKLLQKKKSTGGSEPAMKKSRINAPPSPLPTFKVRKEKLGDRITALQQLVSPFGKTDTASVLHEAIEYIKFLHDQVSLLSTPYLKNGDPMQHQQQRENKSEDGEGQDLRSRGLCLVPIESTYPVARETTADFWTPSFGGNFR